MNDIGRKKNNKEDRLREQRPYKTRNHVIIFGYRVLTKTKEI